VDQQRAIACRAKQSLEDAIDFGSMGCFIAAILADQWLVVLAPVMWTLRAFRYSTLVRF
jgi:hypothetical protein